MEDGKECGGKATEMEWKKSDGTGNKQLGLDKGVSTREAEKIRRSETMLRAGGSASEREEGGVCVCCKR